jgi:hypothetical protein
VSGHLGNPYTVYSLLTGEIYRSGYTTGSLTLRNGEGQLREISDKGTEKVDVSGTTHVVVPKTNVNASLETLTPSAGVPVKITLGEDIVLRVTDENGNGSTHRLGAGPVQHTITFLDTGSYILQARGRLSLPASVVMVVS